MLFQELVISFDNLTFGVFPQSESMCLDSSLTNTQHSSLSPKKETVHADSIQ